MMHICLNGSGHEGISRRYRASTMLGASQTTRAPQSEIPGPVGVGRDIIDVATDDDLGAGIVEPGRLTR
jgi:hypothetical protein